MSKAHTLAAFSQHLFSLENVLDINDREKLHSSPGDRALPIIVIRVKQ